MQIFRWTIAGVILGVIGGLISAILATGITSGGLQRGTSIQIDGWISDWSIGSKASGPYLKAWVARHGLLAMRKSEAVYFIRSTDQNGTKLSETCTYRVSGGPLPGGWWSVTLYDRLGYLPINGDGPLSFDASRASGSTWSFDIAPTPPTDGGPWVSSRNGEDFDLTLRIYHPDPGFLSAPFRETGFPTIERLSCGGAPS